MPAILLEYRVLQQLVVMADFPLLLNVLEVAGVGPVLAEGVNHLHLTVVRFLQLMYHILALRFNNFLPMFEEIGFQIEYGHELRMPLSFVLHQSVSVF